MYYSLLLRKFVVAQITQLKQKIKSIKTTKKITHAVRLVSMSNYSKLEKQNELLNFYQQNIHNTFFELIKTEPEWQNSTIFPQDVFDIKPLIIIVSSSKGLCGSFNSNLLRYYERTFLIEEQQMPSFIVIGTKALKFLKNKGTINIISIFEELTSSNYIYIAEKLTELIFNTKYKFSSVSFFSNYLKNFFLQIPQKISLIPINIPSNLTSKSIEFEWEQDKNTILEFMAINYIKSSILNILFQSLAAESASRFLTMDKATNNAEEYLEELTLQYNKTRQALITREVSELAANF
ncbi:hypothetical protein GF322_00350 [Candidatus Dependentiae bacterium]|nr:hypothetical protein [Candidatus Dependentiae bacterium]